MCILVSFSYFTEVDILSLMFTIWLPLNWLFGKDSMIEILESLKKKTKEQPHNMFGVNRLILLFPQENKLND